LLGQEGESEWVGGGWSQTWQRGKSDSANAAPRRNGHALPLAHPGLTSRPRKTVTERNARVFFPFPFLFFQKKRMRQGDGEF
jgi:hypothetical protein